MPSLWHFEFERAGGDTTTTAATFDPLNWLSFSLTRARRAPHRLTIDLPLWAHHVATDFVSGREWRLSRNGVYWETGLMNACSFPEGEASQVMRLEGWGSAYALLLSRNMIGIATESSFIQPTDADAVIGTILAVDHLTTPTDWFPVAGRTIGTAGTALATFVVAGIDGLALLNQMVDIEGWEWRPGIDSAGAWTFKASGTTVQDLTGTIKLFSPGNCWLASHQADGSELTTNLNVAARVPNAQTRLNGAHGAGVGTLTVDNTNGLFKGLLVKIGTGTANEETKTISDIASGTSVTLTANTANSHSDNDIVEAAEPGAYMSTSGSSAAALTQAHHARYLLINDDSLLDTTRRTEYVAAYLAAYNHVLHSATVVITKDEVIEQCLTAGLAPGDSVKLTSSKLAAFFNDTTVVVQEQTIAVDRQGVTTMTLVVGDPLLTDLDLLTRRNAAARAAAVRSVNVA